MRSRCFDVALASPWGRDFLLLWGGETVSTLGSEISFVAYPLLVLALTHSPTEAGVAGFANRVPWLIFGLPAGALADRWSRRRIMLVSNAVRALAVASIAIGLSLGSLSFAQIVAVAFVEGTFVVAFGVCQYGVIRQVVLGGRVAEAIARFEAKDYGAKVVGPAIGGILFDLARMLPFLADALSYIASFVAVVLVGAPFQEGRAEVRAVERHRFAEVVEGAVWLWRQRFLRACQLLVAVSNFVSGALYLTVIVLAKREGASGSTVGVLFTISGIGGLTGALAAPRLLRRFSLQWVVVGSQWVKALLLPALLLTPAPLLIGVVYGSMLWVAPVWNAGVVGHRTAIIPDRLQGRVQGAASLIAMGAYSLGPLAAGFALARLGSITTVAILVGVTWALAATATLSRSVRRAPALTGE